MEMKELVGKVEKASVSSVSFLSPELHSTKSKVILLSVDLTLVICGFAPLCLLQSHTLLLFSFRQS
jgi:hypothetical protein